MGLISGRNALLHISQRQFCQPNLLPPLFVPDHPQQVLALAAGFTGKPNTDARVRATSIHHSAQVRSRAHCPNLGTAMRAVPLTMVARAMGKVPTKSS
jgi:hypothetical protein